MTWEEYQVALNEDPDSKTSEWKSKMKQKKFQDNCLTKIYQKPQKGKVDLMRLECEMQNVDPHKLWQYVIDPPRTPMIKEAKSYNRVGEHQVDFYMQMKIPLMSARDNIVRVNRHPITDDSYYITCATIDDPNEPPRKGVIRMFSTMQGYIRPSPTTPGNYIYTEISTFDMKGSMPVKLLNMSLASEGAKEMRSICKFMQK